MKDKRVLVTGGAGFLGYHLAHSLPRLGASFVAMNDIAPFFADEYPDDYLLVQIDVRDEEAMYDLIHENKIDIAA